MPLPSLISPQLSKARCKLPVLVSEEVKLAVNLSLERFHYSKQKELDFPSSLLSKERVYVHLVARSLGYISKSKGKGSRRFLTVWKKNMTFKLSHKSVHLLHGFLQKFPVDNKERADLQVPSEFCPFATAVGGSQGKNRSGRLNNGIPQVPQRRGSSDLDARRCSLPVHAHCEQILQLVKDNSVVLVVGETGSGKTTQIPQFLLDDCNTNGTPCRLFCVLPQRLAAIAAAERVAEERGEQVGHTVGYQIGLECRVSPKTLLTFCTSGVLLRTLIAGDTTLSTVTHLIVDEVHERDGLTDFLLTKLKDVVQKMPTLKLLLLSAPMDIELFRRYFRSCQVVYVPWRMFDVEQLFLEDIIRLACFQKKATVKPNITAQGEEKHGPLEGCSQQECSNNAPEKGDVCFTKLDATESTACLVPLLQKEADNCISNIYLNKDPNAFLHLFHLICIRNLSVDYMHSKTSATTLMVCSGQGFLRQMEVLLRLGASINLTDSYGRTALDWAKAFQQPEAEYLLESYIPTVGFDGLAESLMPLWNMELRAKEQDNFQNYHSSLKDEQINLDLIVDLLHHICSNSNDGSVLIFLPRYDEIVLLRDRILHDDRRFTDYPQRYQVFTLHSNMQTLDLQKVTENSPQGVRKLILSTNIAETSITINDVVFVIDSGKEKSFDASEPQMVWISKASALQRMGRAGRCKPGMHFCLYSQFQFENMTEFQVPQLLRMSMQELCLHTKLLVPSGCSVNEFLSKAPEPPHMDMVKDAVLMLKNIDAMNPCEDLTDLGHHLADLPVEPHLGKMVLCAVVLKCLDPVLTIVCTLAYHEPFILPNQVSQKRAALLSRKQFSSAAFSDHMALLRAFQAWQKARSDGWERAFCEKNFLSQGAMEVIIGMRAQLLAHLRAIGFVQARGGIDIRDVNHNSENWAMVKAALLAGTYPKLAHINPQSCSISTSDSQRNIFFHSTSVLSQKSPTAHGEAQSVQALPTDWVIYNELIQEDQRTTMSCCSLVSPITVAVFGGCARLPSATLQMDTTAGELHDSSGSEADEKSSMHLARMKINDWLDFQLQSETAELVFQLRQKWHSLFLRRMRSPTKPMSQKDEATVHVLLSVLRAEEKAVGLQQPAGIGQRPQLISSKKSPEVSSWRGGSARRNSPNQDVSQHPLSALDGVIQKELELYKEGHLELLRESLSSEIHFLQSKLDSSQGSQSH